MPLGEVSGLAGRWRCLCGRDGLRGDPCGDALLGAGTSECGQDLPVSGGSARPAGGVAPAPAPDTVAALATNLPASSWYRRTVSAGTKGPIADECARQRVTLCHDGLPARPVWLVSQRTLGAEPSYAYSISNAPVSTPLSLCGWFSGVRWAVEQCCEAGKTALGMAPYEVRKYPGWHPHLWTTMLAHFFLWRLKVRLGNKSPGAHGVAVAEGIGSGLALTSVYDCGGPGVRRWGAKAQSPGVGVPPQTVPRG